MKPLWCELSVEPLKGFAMILAWLVHQTLLFLSLLIVVARWRICYLERYDVGCFGGKNKKIVNIHRDDDAGLGVTGHMIIDGLGLNPMESNVLLEFRLQIRSDCLRPDRPLLKRRAWFSSGSSIPSGISV